MNKIETPTSPVVKLHLGCGTNKLDGWVNIDSVKGCQPDLVHDITTPLPYRDFSVDEVLAEDLLEHFDKYMRYVVFGEWIRVLKLDGIVTVQVPNFKKILFRYFKFGYDHFVDFIFGETMWRSEVYIGYFGNHKWGYCEETLKNFVRQFGVEPLSLETKGLNLRLVGQKKRHLRNDELDQIQIYSHANDHGTGQAYLPLGVIKTKINAFQRDIEHG